MNPPGGYHRCVVCKTLVEVRLGKCSNCGTFFSAASIIGKNNTLQEATVVEAPVTKPHFSINALYLLVTIFSALACAYLVRATFIDPPKLALKGSPFEFNTAQSIWETAARVNIGMTEAQVEVVMNSQPTKIIKPTSYDFLGLYAPGNTWQYHFGNHNLNIIFARYNTHEFRVQTLHIEPLPAGKSNLLAITQSRPIANAANTASRLP